MKIEKALKIRDKAKQQMYSVYGLAIISKSTSNELFQNVNKVYDGLPNGTPDWVRHYLEGMQEVLRNDLYKNHLEFCYKVENSIVSVVKHSKRYYKDIGIECHDLVKEMTDSGHFWFDSDKPFFLSSEADDILESD